jgi:hypothetical protein
VKDDTKFTPMLNEIIPNIEIPVFPVGKLWQELPESEKTKLGLKSIVGRFIRLFWPTHNEWYVGVVIGYNPKLTHNLVFYDRRLPDVPKCVDYYVSYLYPVSCRGRQDVWKLLK